MMPKTKGTQNAVDKWQRRSSVAGQDYANGVRNPKVPWDTASKAGAANYKTAVVQAANEGRFEKGVSRVGNDKWQKGATEKGPGRFIEGVNIGAPNFQSRIEQVISTIESVQLPPRGPKGSPQNYNRVLPIGEALRRSFGKSGAK